MVENLRPNPGRELPYRLTLHPATVHHRDLSLLGRDEAAALSHQHGAPDTPQVGGLAAHVGPGDDVKA